MSESICLCSRPPTTLVNGVKIALMGPDEAMEWVSGALECPATHIVNHLAAHPTVEAQKDPEYRALLNRADLNVADGMGPVLACRLQGHHQPTARVYGPDFMLAVIQATQSLGVRHGFVGGTPESLTEMLDRLGRRYPKANLRPGIAPPYRAVTDHAVSEDLSRLPNDLDILWVGLGTPKQQIWADLAKAQRPARVIATVGAAFDIHAGRVRQAPAWMQRSGLEWLFRLSTDPRRLYKRYTIDNVRFLYNILVQSRSRERRRG